MLLAGDTAELRSRTIARGLYGSPSGSDVDPFGRDRDPVAVDLVVVRLPGFDDEVGGDGLADPAAGAGRPVDQPLALVAPIEVRLRLNVAAMRAHNSDGRTFRCRRLWPNPAVSRLTPRVVSMAGWTSGADGHPSLRGAESTGTPYLASRVDRIHA